MTTTHEPPPRPAPIPAAPPPAARRRRRAATLALAAALAAPLASSPSRAREAAAPPSPTAWLDALAAVQRQPRAFHGSVGARSLHVGLGLPGPDGRFGGTAVLLDPANHVIATGPVHGRADARSCRLRLDLGDVTARVFGACRPDAVSGTLDEVRHHPFDLIRFLSAKGEDHVVGEVWLTPGP